MHYADIWERIPLGRANRKCKGPEYVDVLREWLKASMAGTEWAKCVELEEMTLDMRWVRPDQ